MNIPELKLASEVLRYVFVAADTVTHAHYHFHFLFEEGGKENECKLFIQYSVFLFFSPLERSLVNVMLRDMFF